MNYRRTVRTASEGGETRTHLGSGLGADYTLCGLDTAGDPGVHAKDPEEITDHKPRITCEHCQAIIEVVKEHLGRK